MSREEVCTISDKLIALAYIQNCYWIESERRNRAGSGEASAFQTPGARSKSTNSNDRPSHWSGALATVSRR